MYIYRNISISISISEVYLEFLVTQTFPTPLPDFLTLANLVFFKSFYHGLNFYSIITIAVTHFIYVKVLFSHGSL